MSIILVCMRILIVMCRGGERESLIVSVVLVKVLILYYEDIETYVASILSLILRKYMVNRIPITKVCPGPPPTYTYYNACALPPPLF